MRSTVLQCLQDMRCSPVQVEEVPAFFSMTPEFFTSVVPTAGMRHVMIPQMTLGFAHDFLAIHARGHHFDDVDVP